MGDAVEKIKKIKKRITHSENCTQNQSQKINLILYSIEKLAEIRLIVCLNQSCSGESVK